MEIARTIDSAISEYYSEKGLGSRVETKKESPVVD